MQGRKFSVFGQTFSCEGMEIRALMGETPHPASSLGHLLPQGEGKEPHILALSRGERVSALCRQVRGHFTRQRPRNCGSAALCHLRSYEMSNGLIVWYQFRHA